MLNGSSYRKICSIEHDDLTGVGKSLLEEAMSETALGAEEDAQLALDQKGEKAA
ncbi:hypothetical protein [Vreelandella andesensis]|uniref:hypothetical protein n=1 Tax=Vreelandella andesensis TaxID=447567 RepID=UPI00142D8048|nr:hypothetical protein [Halomonas andesensis]